MTVRSRLVAAVLFSTLGAGTALAQDFDFTYNDQINFGQDRYKKINVCTPHKMLIQDIARELEELNPSQLMAKITKLQTEKEMRESKIASLESDLAGVKNKKRQQEKRLDQLTHNMDQVVNRIQRKVTQAERDMAQAQRDITHNQKKRSECRGGLLGSFCRSKYKDRIEDARNAFEKAKAEKQQAQNEIAKLPREKAILPGKIAKLAQKEGELQVALDDVITMTPSLDKLAMKIQGLSAQVNEIQHERRGLQRDMDSAQDAFESCRHMRFQAKAFDVTKKQATAFKQNPELCDQVDYLVQVADKPVTKHGIREAHKLVCDIAGGQNPGNGDDFGGDDGDFQDDGIVRLDRVITSPVEADGNYPNNFRNPNYEPKKVADLGADDVKTIRFTVSFDIEKNFDYLLIVDAQGNTVEKIDGQGEKQVEVDSTHVEFFFYSDGRSGGKGFKVQNIELQKY